MTGDVRERTEIVRREVRRAVARLRDLERRVIEGYYFDGMSHGRIAGAENVSVHRVVTAHRQAISHLRTMLLPLVEQLYGIGVSRKPNCEICMSGWRADAEAIIDSKTPDMTWGQVLARIERATGWRAPSPQTIIMHNRKHRAASPGRNTNEDDIAGTTCVEVYDLRGVEDGIGAPVADDGPSISRCLPDAPVDGDSDSGRVE